MITALKTHSERLLCGCTSKRWKVSEGPLLIDLSFLPIVCEVLFGSVLEETLVFTQTRGR